jgi:uncharacterized protein involved in exopolysaccharide biosynthesis
MSLDLLRRRVFRILTRPPELLYALTRHPLLILVFVWIGALILWAKVSSEPMLLEGKARLQIVTSDPVLATLTETGRGGGFRSTTEVRSFLLSQIDILNSETVIASMFTDPRTGLYSAPGGAESRKVDDDDDDVVDSLRDRITTVKRNIAGGLGVRRVPLEPASEVTREVAAFRGRSNVTARPESSSLELTVYGTASKRIAEELKAWIDSYRTRIDNVSREGIDQYLKARAKHFEELESKAWGEIAQWREKNPGISEALLDDLTQQIAQVQYEILQVRSRIELGPAALVVVAPQARGQRSSQPNLYQAERLKLEMEIARRLSGGAGENSREIQTLRNQIEWLDNKINSLPFEEEPQLPAQVTERLEERLGALEERLKDLWMQKGVLNDKLAVLKNLQGKHNRAVEAADRFAMQTEDTMVLLSSNRHINVRVSDGPTVSAEPLAFHPLRMILLGAAGGLGAGILLALLLEIFSGKVRFKHDILSDLGLPVVTVFPK